MACFHLSPCCFLLHSAASIRKGQRRIGTLIASNFKGMDVIVLSPGAINGGTIDEET